MPTPTPTPKPTPGETILLLARLITNLGLALFFGALFVGCLAMTIMVIASVIAG